MTYWPGTKIHKSTGNGFTVPASSAFGRDKGELAKATLARRGAHYGSDNGAAEHGHTVMQGLSKRATKKLKAGAASIVLVPKTPAMSKKARV